MKLKDVDTIEKIQAYIESHLGEDIPIESLTQKFLINRTKLQHLFKDLLGDTVADYITKQKIYYGADRLLNSDDTMGMIAIAVRFTKSYFIKRFKAEYHCTPAEFRSKNRIQPVLEIPRSSVPAETRQ